MRKLLILSLSAVIVLALVLGCQSPQPQPTPTPSPKPSPVASPSPTAKPSPSPAASPKPTPAATVKYGGILRTWSTVNPPGWDMHMKPSYGPLFGQPVFNNLVQFDPTKPDISGGTIIGDLATKWDLSSDGKVYTFTLAQGVKWHDGSAFSADDVVYSLTKMTDPKRSQLAGDMPAFDKVEKVDANTVKVTLKFPSPSFLSQLAGPYAAIESPKTAGIDARDTKMLMGTGPFKFKSYTSGVSVELTKNPDYWKKDAAGNKLPYLDGITFQIMADKSRILDALATKQLDGHPSFLYNDQDEWDRGTKQSPDVKATMYNPPGLALNWLNPNFAGFKDVKVRQALRLLYDKVQMGIAGYTDSRWVNPNRTIFTEAYGLPPAEMNKLIGSDVPFEQRITAAKKLIADAGVQPNTLKFRIVGRNLKQQVNPTQWYADQVKRNLGIDVEIVAREINDARAMRDKLDFEMFLDNPLLLIGDPDEYSSWFKSTGVNNFVKRSAPGVDALWDSQSRQVDFGKRVADTQQIERLMLEDAYIWNMSNTRYSSGWVSAVKGFNVQNIIYSQKLRMDTVWIDK